MNINLYLFWNSPTCPASEHPGGASCCMSSGKRRRRTPRRVSIGFDVVFHGLAMWFTKKTNRGMGVLNSQRFPSPLYLAGKVVA